MKGLKKVGTINTPVPTIYGGLTDQFKDSWLKEIAALKENFGESIMQVLMPMEDAVDILTLLVSVDRIHDVLGFLKDKMGYTFLTDMTATDEETDPRFLLVFHLMNLSTKSRIRIKAPVAEGHDIKTFIPLWSGANWAEREIYDMFGIKFLEHPDLRRILMDVRFEGHPLRKDYPLRGYQVFITPEPIDPELLK